MASALQLHMVTGSIPVPPKFMPSLSKLACHPTTSCKVKASSANVQSIKHEVVKNLKDLQDGSTMNPKHCIRDGVDYLQHLPSSPGNTCFKGQTSKSSPVYLCNITPITPVIQEGPQCGLVALVMAGQLLEKPVSVTEVYRLAVEKEFTKQGEMFSADDMLQLAKAILDCKGRVISTPDLDTKIQAVLAALLQHHPVLVPYDRDCNNEPCMKRGLKAHWAILTGFISVSKSCDAPRAFSSESLNPTVFVYRGPQQYSEELVLRLMKDDLYVFANQGKSIRTHLWSLRELLKSNTQLEEIDPAVNSEEYIVKGNSMEQLKNHLVILQEQ